MPEFRQNWLTNMVSPQIQLAQTKVRRYCEELFPGALQIERDQIRIAYESTLVTVEVRPVNLDAKVGTLKQQHLLPETYVSISAVLVANTPQTPALYQWIATKGQELDFGHTQMRIQSDGAASLTYTYALSADTLDPGELKWAVLAVAIAADKLDDDLKARFGGLRHIDQPTGASGL